MSLLRRARPAALALAAACGGGPPAPAPPGGPGTDVILVSIDTLRADHLGCYGYGRDTSPNLDRFRGDCVLFEQAISHAPSTKPSHASLFTSLLVNHHGALDGLDTALPEENVTMAEILAHRGYRTASFNGAGQLAEVFGLRQGFEVHEQRDERFAEVVPRALAWLQEEDERPFFLFLHTYEVHAPYTPPPRFLELLPGDYDGDLPDAIRGELLWSIRDGEVELDEADLRHLVRLYDAEIRSMDAAFGSFVEGLRGAGLYDDTLIVVVSDHGQEFGEHGSVARHSHTLYDEVLRVPLLVKLPGGASAGGSVAEQVRLIDVLPTVLDVVAIEPPERLEGTSLLPWIAGSAPTELDAVSQRHGGSVASIRSGGWKLYRDGRRGERLYDLRGDPREEVDLADEKRRRSNALRRSLRAALEARPRLQGEPVAPDETTSRGLRALGYAE